MGAGLVLFSVCVGLVHLWLGTCSIFYSVIGSFANLRGFSCVWYLYSLFGGFGGVPWVQVLCWYVLRPILAPALAWENFRHMVVSVQGPLPVH
jgi:hypothetical protein